jgi:hypothetical protein
MDVTHSTVGVGARRRNKGPFTRIAPALPKRLATPATCPATWQEIVPQVPDPIADLDIGDDGTLIVATAKGVSHFTGRG